MMTERRNTALAAQWEALTATRSSDRSTNQDRSLAEGLQPSPLGRPATAASETSI